MNPMRDKPSDPASSARSTVVSFNHYNARGDVVAKSDLSGVVTYETAYEAFGNQSVQSGTVPPDRQRANTKEQDPTGLLNEGFRYRDASTGTFLSRDPLGFKAGLNMYTYVRQNPWTRFDPEGLQALPPPQFPPDVLPPAQSPSSSKNSPPKKQTSQPNQTTQPGSNRSMDCTIDFTPLTSDIRTQQQQADQAGASLGLKSTNITPSGSPTASAKHNVLEVTLPSGDEYMPMTMVKNPAQAKILGQAVGTPVPIYVPPGVDPQLVVNSWRATAGSISNNDASLAYAFRPKGPYDYKQKSPIYDSFGNFEFGAAGTAGGFTGSHLQWGANVVKPGGNDPINTMDIQSGIRAISRGGTLSTEPYP